MDNSNNNSWPPNPNPPDPSGATPTPPPPSAWPTPVQSEPTPVQPYINTPSFQTPPVAVADPSTYPQIPTQTPAQPAPWQSTISPSPLPEQNLPPQYVDPNTTATNSFQSNSSLDNPYGAPIQAPAIDGGVQNQPAYQAYTPPVAPPAQPEPAWSPSNLPEQAPTDLSHLISNSDTNTQDTMQAETVVIPQTESPEVPTISTENKGGIPKWIIGLGAGLLILVAGASAYFTSGVGQLPKNTSLPATEAPKVIQEVSTPAPSETTSPPAAATSSANFGNLQGSNTTPQASSAADIIKARQQQGF